MKRAVRSEPRCRYPVGDGANRVRAGLDGSAALLFCSFADLLEIGRLEEYRDRRKRQERQVYAGN